jgi:hypothetical protein
MIIVSGAACGGGSGDGECVRDDQCASQFCRADGTCGPADVDAPPGHDAPSGGDGPAGACTPNHDGHITADEVPLVAGRMGNFRIATGVTWDTAGTAHTDGTRSWDLSQQLSGDQTSAVALASPSGAWWANDFPTATYATPLSSTSNLIGVFHVGPNVTLLGVVSPDGGTFATKLTYDPPAEIVQLPFANGDAWSSTSTVSGTAQGAATAYTETYDSRADVIGTLATPYGMFPVLRVATDLTRTEGLATLASSRTFAWIAECFGTVATVQSQNLESGSEFSDDAEVRRLAP